MAEDDCFEGLYHFIKVLGEGSFGKAVLYRRYTDNFLVVWKEVRLKSEKEVQAAQHEVDVLSILNHRNVVGYYNNYVDADVMYIEMEYANGGNLAQLVADQEDSMTEEAILWYFYQLCCACAYIHSNGIIHRDIKTMNIFLNKTGILKLGDFGISKMLSSESEAAESMVGTPYYMSPEICKGLSYGTKSDVWSSGCVLYEMLELQKTFDATNQLRLVYSIVTKEVKPVSDRWSKPLRDIVHGMLQKDPADRPSMAEILETPFMKDCARVVESKLGPQNYVRGLSQLAPGTQPVLTNLSSEVFIWGGGKTSPQAINLFKKDRGAVSVCVAPKHFCVVTVEKELYTWSSGQPGEMYGQLGHGDKASYRSPKRVDCLTGVVDATAGDDFTLILLEDSQMAAFGSNYDGCLGVGEDIENSLVPVPVPFFSGVVLTSLSCGDSHVMATTDSGSLFGWGNGEFGCLGNDGEDIIYEPQQLEIRGAHVARVVCGKRCSFLITSGGKLMATGDNESNKLGINKIGRKGVNLPKCSETFTFKPVNGLSSVAVRDVACGVDHTLVLDAYDRVWSLGSNKCGQRGVGNYKNLTQPTIVRGNLAGKKVALIAAGDRFSVATTSANEVFSWGYRNHGRLGDGIVSDLANNSRNSICSPQPIFSSLHYIPALSTKGWCTLLVAEQVISAQFIGTGDSMVTQTSRQEGTDPLKTPTWIQNELENAGDPLQPVPEETATTGYTTHGDVQWATGSTSGVSSAYTSALTQSTSGDSSALAHSTSGVFSANTSDLERSSPISVACRNDLSSPPPVYRPEFSFSSAISPPETPTPAITGPSSANDLVSLQDRVRQLEEDLATERERVRERDGKIADLEQKLLQYQISELKSVLG